MNLDKLPRFRLAFLPTPIAALNRLTQKLSGPRILIKRDDLTGLAFGGNKTRKLEFLIGEALATKCESIITGGAAQSNHCRQTAAAAAAAGLRCHLALSGSEPDALTGNLLLDHLLGAKIHWCGDARKGERIPDIADQLRAAGESPYIIPYGGSNAVGAVGLVEAVRELADQIRDPISHVVFASSSRGTHAGLALGARLFMPKTTILGIRIDKEERGLPFRTELAALTNETAARIGVSEVFSTDDFAVDERYLGGGYGVVGELERSAMRTLAETEGIVLDPVYTGRAFGGLLDMIRRGSLNRTDSVLFWHTGGTPAVFAYSNELLS